jgi:L-glyceraldehyde 3-phosphate reductase
MAISWVLRDDRVTSALMGASRWSQVEDALGALDNTSFSDEELAAIDRFAVEGDINLWARSSDEG